MRLPLPQGAALESVFARPGIECTAENGMLYITGLSEFDGVSVLLRQAAE